MVDETSGASAVAQPHDATSSWPHPARAWTAVGILFLAYVVAYVDRLILTLLIPQIKADLHLTDTEIGLLAGFAFTVFYATLAVPIGRFADRYNRKKIILYGMLLWTAMTSLCGLAGNFFKLFIARIGVGVGEATLGPCALSIISDCYPRERRARPIAVFVLGGVVGVSAAYLFGGLVIEFTKSLGPVRVLASITLQPWQLTFVIVSLPGLLVALLFFAIKEPRRQGLLQSPHAVTAVGIAQIAGFLKKRWKAYAALYLGVAFAVLFAYATLTWLPTLLIRRFGMPEAQIGAFLGVSALVAGTTGTMAATWFAEFLQRRRRQDALLLAILAGILLGGVALLATVLMPTARLACGVYALALFLTAGLTPLPHAALQLIAPNQMRGFLASLFFLSVSTIAVGGGPLIVALITDYVLMDENLIHYSLAMVGAVAVPLSAALCMWGRKDFELSVQDANDWSEIADAQTTGGGTAEIAALGAALPAPRSSLARRSS